MVVRIKFLTLQDTPEVNWLRLAAAPQARLTHAAWRDTFSSSALIDFLGTSAA